MFKIRIRPAVHEGSPHKRIVHPKWKCYCYLLTTCRFKPVCWEKKKSSHNQFFTNSVSMTVKLFFLLLFFSIYAFTCLCSLFFPSFSCGVCSVSTGLFWMKCDRCDALIDSQHAAVPPENWHRPETQRLSHFIVFSLYFFNLFPPCQLIQSAVFLLIFQ